jgi:dTDP-4-dehydrorhamnose reductase
MLQCTRPRILVLGCRGQVGRELAYGLTFLGDVVARHSGEIDFERLDELSSAIRRERPDVVVNAAAYTAVDAAEDDRARAGTINRDAVRVLGETAADLGVPVVHYSTDYVYDGSGEIPRLEDDPTGPINAYGATKLEGDRALLDSGANALIFRTSWVYGHGATNFVSTILSLARERSELRVVDDQIGAPTSAALIAQTTALVLARDKTDLARFVGEHRGVVHLASAGHTSWFGFADAILDHAIATEWLERRPRLVPIPSADYPTRADRPKNSRLSLEKLREAFGITPPTWRQDLAEHFRRRTGRESVATTSRVD